MQQKFKKDGILNMSEIFDETLIGQPSKTQSTATIIDVDQASFMKEVIEASQKIPVLVDFWAPWCGPCKQLTPVLEQIITAAKGRVRLAKIDIETNKSLAAQLAQMGLPLQSIPLVVAFWKGQVVDLFQGVQPASEIKKFLESILKTSGSSLPATDLLIEGKKALNDNNPAEAIHFYAQVLETEPEAPEAWGGMIRSLLALNDIESAEEAASQIPEKLNNHPEVTGALAALTIKKESATAIANLESLKQSSSNNPQNFELKLQLATALNAADQKSEAADILLDLIKQDRDWNDGAAKTELLRFFEAWGLTDPTTISARRKLSALLFS